jgi:hypothetical protein
VTEKRCPCSIEGCHRSTARKTSVWICGTHWKRHCPPRSLRRRTYHRYFARAKRHGWTPEIERGFWRFWELLVRLANAAEKRDAFDMTEINKLFGWTDD